MAVTIIFYFLFVMMAITFVLVLFKFLDKVMCWIGEIIQEITK